MFSVLRFLGKEDRFLELLKAGAEEAHQSIRAIVELVNDHQEGQAVDKSIASRKHEKEIHHEIKGLLCNSVTSPFDREDIEALSNALSRITKIAKKFVQQFLLLGSMVNADIFRQQLELLDTAACTLSEMIQNLCRGLHVEQAQEQNHRLQRCEGDADKLMHELLGKLYNGQHSTLQVLATRDLLELLEKLIDRYRDAGNVIFHIVLKNS